MTGTAGAGKSILASRLLQWYSDNSSYPISLNLDPGAESLPYEPDVDVRDYVDMKAIMEEYNLGPNGSLIIASDLISTHLEEIQNEVNERKPRLRCYRYTWTNRIVRISSQRSILRRKFSCRR